MPSFEARWRGTGAGLFLVFVLAACSEPNPETFEFQQVGTTMGTTFSIKVPNLPDGIDAERLKAEINAELKSINETMSTYLTDSELSLLNRNRSTDWIGVSDQLAGVLAEALRVSELSDGAYDVTVGPLVNLWGFGPEEVKQTVPDLDDIQARMKMCGYKKIRLNPERNSIRKDDPDIYIDLSSLAKGYGVDEVANLLADQGVESYLVEIGGELRVQGGKANGTPWNIAIEKPLVGKRSIGQVIQLFDIAVATSGDYRNFFEDHGTRYSHTVDPRTGMPIVHALASVTVMDRSAMRADALATAFMVLGPDAGRKLALAHNIAALFIERNGSGFATLATPAFPSASEVEDKDEPISFDFFSDARSDRRDGGRRDFWAK